MLPKLRPVEARWITHQEQPALLLRDRLDLSGRSILVPAPLAPLLGLCDGTRDAGRISSAFQLRYGIPLPPGLVESLVEQLDQALLLESPRYAAALAEALAEYRSAPYRLPALAGSGYLADPEELGSLFVDYLSQVDGDGACGDPTVRGLVCPHIDFARGGPVYARAWREAAAAVREAEVVVVFGTDHMGAPGALTLTRQPYATPWGPLPLAREAVEAMAAALGEEAAFAEELHHRGEHSLELAMCWLHYFLGAQPVEVLPVLCGSFQPFVESEETPSRLSAYEGAFAALRAATAGRRVLVVAAADLAHVGPAFGDPDPLGPEEKTALARADEWRLAAACSGDPEAFLGALRRDGDSQRVCGLPPIYCALLALGGAQGEVTAYAQCPADEDAGSLVSVAGISFS